MTTVRPLCSADISPFLCYYGPIRLPLTQEYRLWFPCIFCPFYTARKGLRNGSPGCLVCSFGTRSLLSPRAAQRVHVTVASPLVAGFTTFGRLADRHWCNEADLSSLALGLAPVLSLGNHPEKPVRTAAFRVFRYLRTLPRSYMLNGQLTHAVLCNCMEHTDSAGVTEGHEAHEGTIEQIVLFRPLKAQR